MPKAIVGDIIQIKLPPNQALHFDLDVAEIERLARDFGITLPINFRWSTGERKYGHHRIMNRNGRDFHQICIEQNQSAEQARNTVLHELRHAIQKENHWRESGMELWSALKDFSENVRVKGSHRWTRSIEVDAREFAENYYHEYEVTYS